MKKLVLVAAVLLGGIAASQAGVNVHIGFGNLFPRPVVISRPAPVACPAPVVVAPACPTPAPVVVVPRHGYHPRYGYNGHRYGHHRDWDRHGRGHDRRYDRGNGHHHGHDRRR